MKKLFTSSIWLVIFCLLFSNAMAQDVTVRGKVTDASDGLPVPGVSIAVKGTTRGVQTDADGNYSISAPNGATLVFSFIGYTSQEKTVTGATTIDVVLSPSAQNLDEVVVTGYGTQKRRDLTGSISSVSGQQIEKLVTTNPVAALQGKVAGLTVVNSGQAGASPTIRIRGINSTNSANPIYVVDGIIQDNIDYLNPGDIESIDLLRDASSTAIYGMKGANGVIAVTTKKASRGQTIINFQSTVGMQHVTDRIEVADAAGFRKLYDAQLANAGAAPFDYTNYTANTDWQDQILQDAVIQTNSLSFSNAGEKTTTNITLGYNNQDGVLKHNNFQKFIARFNQSIAVSDNFKVGGELTGYHYRFAPPAANFTSALWAAPIIPIQQDATTYYATPSFQRTQVGNPVAGLNRSKNTSVNRGYRITGNLFAEVKFLKDFTLRSAVYTDLGFLDVRAYSPPPFTFIYLGEGINPTTTFYDTTVRTSVRQRQDINRRFQQDHTLTYNKVLGDHSFNGILGFTTLAISNSALEASRIDPDLLIPNDPNLWYLNIVNVNNSPVMTTSGAGGREANVGAFARVSYSYQNKYLLNATVRRDGNSRFAPENRWGTFGSVGLGWVASEEAFFKDNIKGIDFLKLRAAWGRLGNANGVGANLYQQTLSNSITAVFGNNTYPAIENAYIPDPDLHYEVVQGIDLGLDLRALNNRFSAEINLYNKTTNDILTSFPIPAAGGLTKTFFTNLGKLTNKGIEVSLGWNDKIGQNFTYGISPIFSYNKNEVNSLGNDFNFKIIRGAGGTHVTESGQSVGYFYGYRQVGIYQSSADLEKMPAFATSLPGDIAYADLNGDGVITDADREYLGTPFPPYTFGLNVSLGYKGFDVILEGQGVAGNKVYAQRRTANFAQLNYEANRLNAWTAPGTSNVEPIISQRGNNLLFSSYFLEPGDYFRLRNLQLGYTFGKQMLSKIGVKNLRVFVSGQNVKTWSKVTGYSPEAPISTILEAGVDNGVYPVPAIYSFGLNVTF